MKMDKVAGSGNDEFFTLEYAIKPLLKYLDGYKTIWCPFDTAESNFVKMLMNIAFPCATLADRKNISPVKIMIHVFAICNP